MTVPDSDCVMGDGIDAVPLSPGDERKKIEELLNAAESNSKAGDLYYVVSSRWWRSWKRYAEPEETNNAIDKDYADISCNSEAIPSRGPRPGRIDNADLVSGEPCVGSVGLDLRSGLQERDDYELVPEEVWKRLLEWYGGGPALPRKLISQGCSRNDFVIEICPLRLNLVVSHTGKSLTFRVSRKDTVGQLRNLVSETLKLDPQKMRIWDFFNKRKSTMLTDPHQTLEDVQLQMDQDVLVEISDNGVWPTDNTKSGYEVVSSNNELSLVLVEPSRASFSIAGGPTLCNGYSGESASDLLQRNSLNLMGRVSEDGYDRLSTNGGGSSSGLMGLRNLGNTCFMNSAVQCLVHTPPLVEFFLEDYSKEINRQNPLGMDGELALSFGELLRKLWAGDRTPIAPRAFKAKLARFAPQFSGYNQHDSQELLAFLLDGLHEDLNRVKHKPYIEAKEADGCPDDAVADEYWANHKTRNDSIIVDFCQGQYKSTLVCPVCSKVSVTFDPFMYLSLPLPSTATRSMTVTVFYGNGSGLPMPFTMNVPKQGNCKDLSQELSVGCCLSTDESLLLAEVYNNRIYRYLDNPYESLTYIKDDDHIVAYRLPLKYEKLRRLELLHQRNDRYSDFQKNVQWKTFGTPLVTCLPEGARSAADIQNAVNALLAPLFRNKCFNYSNGIKTCANDGSSEGGHDTLMENYDDDAGCEHQDATDMGSEYICNGKPLFDLCITDERGLTETLEGNASSRIQVTMRWSDADKDSYDINFLENLPEVFKSGFGMKKIRQEAITLFSCLDAFLKEEPLGPDDMWYCPSCKEHRQATKKLDLWRLPEVLVVHLKRFSYSRYFKNKLDTLVNFPISSLDLTKYVRRKDTSESYVYELYAISNHYGGLGGGHYTAYVKLIEENRWYSFDDSHVSAVSADDIKTSAAYVLFYRRVKVKSASAEYEEQSLANGSSC